MAPGAPLSVRLRARISPELVASILSAVVIVLVVAAVLWLPRPSGVTAVATPSATPGPTGQARPSVAARAGSRVVWSPSSAATAAAPSTAEATSTPAPNLAARALLEIVDRLVAQRADLEKEQSQPTPSVHG